VEFRNKEVMYVLQPKSNRCAFNSHSRCVFTLSC